MSNLCAVAHMVLAISDRNILLRIGINALDTGNVNAISVGVRSALVVGVDAAGLAKIMFRRVGAKLVEAEIVLTLYDLEISQRHRRGNSAPARTHRTITPPHINKTVWKVEGEFNSAAVAGGFVCGHGRGLWVCGEIDYWA